MKKTGEHPARSLGFLSRYHDGELSREEREDFDRHADRCAECRIAAAEYEAVLAMYRAEGSDLPDDRLAARISRRIDTEVRHRAPVRFITLQIDLVWASVLAVGLVAALALYAVLARRPASPVSVAENAAPSSAAEPKIAAPSPPPAPTATEPAPGPQGPREKPARPPATDRRDTRPLADAPFAPETDRAPAEGGVPASPAAPPPGLPEFGSGAVESPARPEAREPLPVGGPVSAPILIRKVAPIVSSDAVRDFSGGSPVVIVAVISEDGEVTQPRIIRSNPAFDGAVLRAVGQWRYRPALKDGKPVAAYLTITVNPSPR